jgi:hypothetical protein
MTMRQEHLDTVLRLDRSSCLPEAGETARLAQIIKLL